MTKTCFCGNIVNGRILDQIIADAVDALVVSIENDAAQDSWICILDGFVRYQIPGLNQWLTIRLLPTLTDLFAERPVSALRRLVHLLDTLIVNYVANQSGFVSTTFLFLISFLFFKSKYDTFSNM